MGRFLKQYDKENMRTAMLKHEETFREQVNELHRLYRIQKLLMRDMERNALKRQQISGHQNGVLDVENRRIPHPASYSFQLHGRPKAALDLERPAEDYIDADCENLGADDESEIELTLAIGSFRRRKGATSFTSDSGTSLSSSSTESGGENIKFHDWGPCQVPNRGFTSARKGDFSVGGTMRDNRLKQPPWMIECLSLNMA